MKLPTGPGKREGMLAGFAVTAGIVLAALVVSPLINRDIAAVEMLAVVGLPTVVTGTLVGWLLGPRAWRIEAWGDRLGLSLGLAIVSTSIGCLLVGFAAGFMNTPIAEQGMAGRLFQGLAGAVILWPLGMFFVGWIAGPLVFGVGLVWTWVMTSIRPDDLVG